MILRYRVNLEFFLRIFTKRYEDKKKIRETMIHKIGGWIRWRFSEFPTPFEISRERENNRNCERRIEEEGSIIWWDLRNRRSISMIAADRESPVRRFS